MSQLEDLVAAYRILADQGVVDAYGHVSVRSEGNPNRYFLSRSLAPESVTEDDIMEYDLDSNPVDGRDRDSVLERFIHGEVYKARPDVMSVVHNHSPMVVPFSVTGVPIRALFHMAGFIGQGLPTFEIRDVEMGSDLLVRTPALGAACARVLADQPAALMRGHGAVVVGESIPRSVGRSVYLEINARMQLQAIQLAGTGGHITYFDDGESRASIVRQDYMRAWPLWRDKALGSLKPR